MRVNLSNYGYVEGLLRPAEELLSAVMFALAIVMIWVLPELFLLTFLWRVIVSALLFVFLMNRLKQGLDVLAYRKGLLQLPFWAMSSADMPVYKNKLFLGKGFLEIGRAHV